MRFLKNHIIKGNDEVMNFQIPTLTPVFITATLHPRRLVKHNVVWHKRCGFG
jgi:hypothetical protein